MPRSDCTIIINFVALQQIHFTYFCISQPPPWHVSTDGNICPASRSRAIELVLEADANEAHFAGIKLSISPDGLESHDPYFNNTKIRVQRYPEDRPTRFLLDDNVDNEGRKLWFSVGVEADGQTYWDDPKIYNPPDD